MSQPEAPSLDVLRQHCKALCLPTIRQIVGNALETARREDWALETFLHFLLGQELAGRFANPLRVVGAVLYHRCWGQFFPHESLLAHLGPEHVHREGEVHRAGAPGHGRGERRVDLVLQPLIRSMGPPSQQALARPVRALVWTGPLLTVATPRVPVIRPQVSAM